MSAQEVDDSVSMCSRESEEKARSESPFWAHWDTSTAPSSPRTSIYSFASSVERHLVTQTVHGRELNNTNEKYMLPADLEEHGRLDIQHEMLKVALGGLYARPAAPAIRRVLSSRRDDGAPMVLDIGTGSGTWAIDMAKQYPHADVIGLDLAPPNAQSVPPPNVKFECDDANLGLSQYLPESFAVIHCRCITTGIINYRNLLQQIWTALQPGGVLITVDCDMLVYSEKQEPITALNENEEGFSWLNKILVTAYEGISVRNPNANAYIHASRWLRELEEEGYEWEERGERAVWIPIGPWTEELKTEPVNKREHLVAELMREDFYRMGATCRPLLLLSGHFEETVDRWIRMQQEETRDMKVKLYVKWICNWAVKKRRPSTPEADI
ncbi:hypothetical protein FRB90_005651 [Tulasnella sp. 427]|nr:hypothetical protein FRB90_005651 [Tulasnella sp. 427]